MNARISKSPEPAPEKSPLERTAELTLPRRDRLAREIDRPDLRVGRYR